MICPACSKENQESALYCNHCGQHLFPAQRPAEPPPAAAPAEGAALGPLWSAPSDSADADIPPAAVGVPAMAAAGGAGPVAVLPAHIFAPQPPPAGVAAVRYAGFWRRVLAYIIDAIAINCVEGIMMSLGVLPQMAGTPSPPQLLKYSALVVPFVWLYFSLCESSPLQATLGKLALDLRVTDQTGARVSFLRATGRFFGKMLSAIILGLGFIMAGFTEKKQALHDMIAGCLVVRR